MSEIRKEIVDLLQSIGPMTTGRLCNRLKEGPSKVRHHIGVLVDLGVVSNVSDSHTALWSMGKASAPKSLAKQTTSDRIVGLLEEGPMARKEIQLMLGLAESEAKNCLQHLHIKGLVQCVDKTSSRPLWALPGHDCVQVYLAEQRKSPVGRYLTQPAGVPV